jgi:DNA adenine methylase
MKPFLKWAGGKYKLLKHLLPLLNGERLVEPFVGAGAVFLNSSIKSFWINDINKDLINSYLYLKNDINFIDDLKEIFSLNSKENYLRLREEFNTNADLKKKALLFIYLNRHCFNGLCRYNKSGKFNVPFGKYKTIYFPDRELLHAQKILQNTKITNLDFREVFKGVEKTDVLYVDPPYFPVNKTSNFVDYFIGGFGDREQEDLFELTKNTNAIISNSCCEKSLSLYKDKKIIEIDVQRNISCKERNKVKEVIVVCNES